MNGKIAPKSIVMEVAGREGATLLQAIERSALIADAGCPLSPRVQATIISLLISSLVREFVRPSTRSALVLQGRGLDEGNAGRSGSDRIPFIARHGTLLSRARKPHSSEKV